jgi:hypothetical protein
LLDVLSPHHAFSQIKLKVVQENDSITALEYKYQGAPRTAAIYPLVLSPHVKISYFQKKEPLSITKMIMGNPMMIVMAISFGAIVFFPQLLNGMDKDQMKELMEQQKQQGLDGDPTNALKKLFGMESKADDDDE